MSTPLVVIDKTYPHITRLGLNRPEKRNALSIALLEQLIEVLGQVRKDISQRVVILHGVGNVFCAGLDLDEVADKERAHQSGELVATVLKRVYEMPQVTIAAVQGSAIGGGAGLVCACDLALAVRGTQIGFPETRRGLVAALVSALLHRQVAGRHVRELLLVAEPVDAQRAYEMGLINRIVPEAVILEEAAVVVAQKVLQGAPEATVATKRLIDSLQAHTLDQDFQSSLDVHLQARNSKEAEEGIRAFLEKRNPSWN